MMNRLVILATAGLIFLAGFCGNAQAQYRPPGMPDGMPGGVPINMPGGLNPYAYAGNNPYKYVDPLGFDAAPPGYGNFYYNNPNPTRVRIGPQNQALINEAATMNRGMGCFAACVRELASNTSSGAANVQMTSMYLAAPISKQTLGYPRSLGGGAYTTFGSEVATLGRNLPRLPIKVLKTAQICRVAARANEIAAAGEIVYNAGAIGSCMAGCR